MSTTSNGPTVRPPQVLELRGRANLYRLLAQLYAKSVDVTALRVLDEGGVLQELVADGDLRDELLNADEAYIEELAHFHTATFFGPSNHVATYASIHHPEGERRGVLWGSATTWFRRFALDHGLEFKGKGYHGIPDDLHVQLDVIGHMLDREADLVQAEESERVELMQGSLKVLMGVHMLPWVRVFAAAVADFVPRLESAAARTLYGGLAVLTLDLLEAEGARLGVDNEQPEA